MIYSKFKDKRSYRRLDMRLPLEYRKPSNPEALFSQSVTANVSTGGVYFETTDESLATGDTLAFKLSIPAGDNRFPKNGTISTTGKIIRRVEIEGDLDEISESHKKIGIAASFHKGFKLEF